MVQLRNMRLPLAQLLASQARVAGLVDEQTNHHPKNNSGSGARRSSWPWNVVDARSCVPGKACRKLTQLHRERCGEPLTTLGGPTAMMKNHVMFTQMTT